jgi:hypothetical protein
MLRQSDHKLRELPVLGFHFDLPAMLLHDDVVANRQSQSRALSRRLRRKKRIENLLANICRNAIAIVANADFDFAIYRRSKVLVSLHFDAGFSILKMNSKEKSNASLSRVNHGCQRWHAQIE